MSTVEVTQADVGTDTVCDSACQDSHSPGFGQPSARLPDAARVLSVTHWTERLFSFRVERPASLRFRSGEFVMLGLMNNDRADGTAARPVLRAYSIASPSWEETLEFYSIKVPNGPLTSRLQHIRCGDDIILKPRPVGTLVLDALLPGKRLWLLATGTGIAPFASLVRDPEVYEKFESVVLMHTCRQVAELKYGQRLVRNIYEHEVLSEIVGNKLNYYPSTTREDYKHRGRITESLLKGNFYARLGIPPLNSNDDRCMICGSLAFNQDIQAILHKKGFSEGSNNQPASYVIEKAFVG